MLNKVTLIGIDVGWSESRPSCGIAVSNRLLPLGDANTPGLDVDGGRIRARRFRKSKLVEILKCWSDLHAEQLANAIIVIDGPLGPDGPPLNDRAVDRQCASGAFRGWSQPTQIAHSSSAQFIGATYELLAALGRPRVWILGNPLQQGITVIETNPTVALAVMMPRVPLEQIASRRRALPYDGVLISAKSDWYWRNGAARQVARALATGSACSEIASETDHDLCAALTCLALAHQFVGSACDNSRAVALGDRDGIYLLPAEIDNSWKAEFCPPSYGEAKFGDHSSQCGSNWGAVTSNAASRSSTDDAASDAVAEECETAKGDSVIFTLADDSIWEKHNRWLNGLPSPVSVVPHLAADLRISLTHAVNHGTTGQWTVLPPTTEIARRTGRSSAQGYLSLHNPWPLAVRLLE